MKTSRRTASWCAGLALAAAALSGCGTAAPASKPAAVVPVAASAPAPAGFAKAVREKPDVTIVVTDSGLGGLSVAAELAARLPASGIARSARVVFVNALLDDAIGYNDLKTEADKARVFDAVLDAIDARWKPDLLLIACNTLSVVWDDTRHARAPTSETVGIVGLGADLVAARMKEQPSATAVIFATRTTVESGAHRKLLVERGIPADRVVGEPCHRLAGAIERDSTSDETSDYVNAFVAEALAKVPAGSTPLIASLNCTHFGYAKPAWQAAFAAFGRPDVTILDPNPLMADLALREGGPKRWPSTAVTVEVVSKVPIGADVVRSLGGLLRTVSPATADALAAWRHEPKLFDVVVDPSAIVR